MEPDENNRPGYGKKWKSWVGVYLAIGAVVYFLIYMIVNSGGYGG
ncbi:MAG: hypothetical protein ACRDKZ_03775 [Actinomycetota bacterium]